MKLLLKIKIFNIKWIFVVVILCLVDNMFNILILKLSFDILEINDIYKIVD